MTEDEAKQISWPHTPWPQGGSHDPKRCCAHISGDWRGSQCRNSPKHWYGRLGYCGTHDPVRIKQRREARDEAFRREREARNRAYDAENQRRKLRDRSLEAVKRIASGHNDPMTLCRELLAEFGETYGEGQSS